MRRDVGAAPVKRGRPPRLSRDALLDAALALLERAPRESLTVARVAAEVDAVPAALYRHFASLDELLDGVLARVLAAVRAAPVRKRAAWPAQIGDWMTTLRRELLRYPQVLRLIGRRGRTSPAWLEAVAAPLEILERAGLRGAQLARAHLWLTETTIALVVQEAALSLPEQIRGARAALREVAPARRAALSPLLARLGTIDADEMFAFVVDRTVVALADLVEHR
jgi:TetR/AcrR family transcriptional regulator, tetracycline repressor protein